MSMNRTSLRLAATLLLAATLSAATASDQNRPEQTLACPYEVWLGRQKNVNQLFGKSRFIVDRSGSNGEDPKWDFVKNEITIELRIVAGSKVKLPDTKNGYTTLINGEVASVSKKKNLQIMPYSMYVVGVFRQKESLEQPGRYIGGRYYSLNARISKGPLKGAVVHFLDGRVTMSLKDPKVAVYKIPAHIKTAEGILDYQIIRVSRK